MEYTKALKEISKHRVILTIGNEPFFRDQVKNKIISLNKEYESHCIDASALDENTIIKEISSKYLFQRNKIYCIKNFTKIKNLDFFLNNNSENIFILDSDVKGKSKKYKDLEKKSLLVECSKPKPWELENDGVGKILGYLTNMGLSISKENAQYLYSQVGYDLYKLMREMQKIVSLKKEKNEKCVSLEDINKICVKDIHYDIYCVIDLLLQNKKKEALLELNKIFRYESSPGVLLINSWFTHLENILYLKNCKENKYITLPEFIINKKIRPYVSSLKEDKILESLDFLINMDYKLRKGSFDLRLHLENFIINF